MPKPRATVFSSGNTQARIHARHVNARRSLLKTRPPRRLKRARAVEFTHEDPVFDTYGKLVLN
jgi:hypothetical protein